MPAVLSQFSYGFLLLLLYSFIGWCGEMVYCSLGQRKLCEKRGFLNGPLCPIYGHGALLVLWALHGGCKNPLFTFLLGALLTSAVEYVTSFVMEKLFHMRWWDYSKHRFNLNGRVCLLNSTLFGLACVFLCHVAHPPLSDLVGDVLSGPFGPPLTAVLLAVYLADIAVSVRSAIRVSASIRKLHALQAELEEKLDALREEHRAAEAARRQRLEEAVTAAVERVEERRTEAAEALQKKLEPLAEAGETLQKKLEPLTGAGEELAQRLEAAKDEAQQRLQSVYRRLDFFDRRLVNSFPTLRSTRHNDALEKLRSYWAEHKSHR